MPEGAEELDGTIITEKIKYPDGSADYVRYVKGEFLGKGGFANCFKVTNAETKEVFAAKVVDKKSLQRERTKQKLMSEIKIHKTLDHENIVNFKHFFEDQHDIYILLELCENLTLQDMLKTRKRLHELEV